MANSDNKQSENGKEPCDGFYKFLEYELNFQRARKQEIFSWASSLLVAMIGGVVALTAVKQVVLTNAHRWALTGAIVILCACSCPWIGLHWAEYLRVRKRLASYYNQIAANDEDSPWRYDYPAIAVIVALSVVAIISVWSSVWWPITFSTAR